MQLWNKNFYLFLIFDSPLTSWPIVLILHAIKYSVNPSHDGYRSSFWVKEVCSGMKILKNYHFWMGCMIWNRRSIRRSRQLAGMHLDIDRTSLCGLEPVICEHKRSINRCTDHRSWILASATKWFPLMAEKMEEIGLWGPSLLDCIQRIYVILLNLVILMPSNCFNASEYNLNRRLYHQSH